MGAVAPFAMAGGSLLSAGGSILGGMDEQALANYKAQIAVQNKQREIENATNSYQTGEIAAGNETMRTAGMLGREKAGQGASGVDVNKGSPADVRASTAGLGVLDALTIRNNAARRTYGYEQSAQNYGTEAALDRYAGQKALTAGYLGAGKSLIGGASSFAQVAGIGGGGSSDLPSFSDAMDWSKYPSAPGAWGNNP